MFEASFEISCGQCGGVDFVEIFPVPAETYRIYGQPAKHIQERDAAASVFACLQCGHLEKFIDLSPSGPYEQSEGDVSGSLTS